MFRAKSVERARVEEIAVRSGVSVACVYSHFSSKELLAVAYLDAVFDVFEHDLRGVQSIESPLERVLAAGDAYMRHVIDFPVASRMANIRAAYPRAEHQHPEAKALDQRMATALMSVAGDIREAILLEEIPPIPVDEALVFAWGAWHGVATMVVRGDQLAIPADVASRALARGRAVLLAGLRA